MTGKYSYLKRRGSRVSETVPCGGEDAEAEAECGRSRCVSSQEAEEMDASAQFAVSFSFTSGA